MDGIEYDILILSELRLRNETVFAIQNFADTDLITMLGSATRIAVPRRSCRKLGVGSTAISRTSLWRQRMAGPDGSSEEFVDDDSAEEEEEEEEEASSASLDSEEGDDLDDDSDADVFEPKQLSRKKPKVEASTALTNPKGQQTGAKPASKSRTSASQKTASQGQSKGKGRAAAAAAAAAAKTKTGKHCEHDTTPSQVLSSQGDDVPATPDATPTATEGKPLPSPASTSASTPRSRSVSTTSATNDSSSKKTTTNRDSGASERGPAKAPKAAIGDYMAKANRPFSVINVFDNLHKKIPKAMVQKILDELVSAGTVKLQEYGKSRIYYANQDTLPNGAGDVSDAKLQRLEQEANDLTKRVEVIAAQAREAQSRVQALTSQPTDVSLEEQLGATANEVEEMEARNASIKGQGHKAIAGGMKAAKADFNKYRALWVGRKRNAMDVIDMISDGMEKKPKHVMELTGVEPDEEPIPPKL